MALNYKRVHCDDELRYVTVNRKFIWLCLDRPGMHDYCDCQKICTIKETLVWRDFGFPVMRFVSVSPSSWNHAACKITMMI